MIDPLHRINVLRKAVDDQDDLFGAMPDLSLNYNHSTADLPVAIDPEDNKDSAHDVLLDDEKDATTIPSPNEPQQGCGTITERRRLVTDLQTLLWPICSLATAAACLIAIVVLLKIYEDQPPPAWTIGSLAPTLNTIVSILSAGFRATLLMPVAFCISQLGWVWLKQPRPLDHICLYDSASRCPLGSSKLIFFPHLIHYASLGALINILTLASDPFFQQLLSSASREVVPSTSADEFSTDGSLIAQQIILIRWQWITLPVILLTATKVLLVITFLATRANGIGFWADSPLTLLYHGCIESGVEGVDNRWSARSMDDCSKMQKIAKGYRAQICRRDSARILISAIPDPQIESRLGIVNPDDDEARNGRHPGLDIC